MNRRIIMVLGLLMVVMALLVGCTVDTIKGTLFSSGTRNTTTEQSFSKNDSVQKLEQKKITPTTDGNLVVPQGIPVLMYHMVADIKDNDAVIDPKLFKEQMTLLKEKGFHPISMEQLYDYIKDGKPVPEKPVVINFDDGYKDTYTVVYPIMKELNFPFTVYVNPGDVGTRLTWSEIKEMHEGGVTIGNHGYDHVPMDELTIAKQKDNIVKAQHALKEQLGIDNPWFCYPYGARTSETETLVKELGLKGAVTMNPGWAHRNSNLYALPRIWIGNAVTLKYFEERITTETYTDL